MSCPRRDRGSGESGQATVELALLTPLLVLLLLAVAQVGLVARDQILVVHAARAGARAAAVDPRVEVAVSGALEATSLPPDETEVHVVFEGPVVTVTVAHRSSTTVPLVGALVDDVLVRATVTFRVER